MKADKNSVLLLDNNDLRSLPELNKWDIRWMGRAKQIAQWSKDPTTRVGSIAVDPIRKRCLAEGYNGFPKRMRDRAEWLVSREQKYMRTIHAEMNVICDAVLKGITLEGATLYVYGLHCCENCATVIAQAGIDRVIQYCEDIPERWYDSVRNARRVFRDCDMDVVSITHLSQEFSLYSDVIFNEDDAKILYPF